MTAAHGKHASIRARVPVNGAFGVGRIERSTKDLQRVFPRTG
jgi:hypothetical protein